MSLKWLWANALNLVYLATITTLLTAQVFVITSMSLTLPVDMLLLCKLSKETVAVRFTTLVQVKAIQYCRWWRLLKRLMVSRFHTALSLVVQATSQCAIRIPLRRRGNWAGKRNTASKRCAATHGIGKETTLTDISNNSELSISFLQGHMRWKGIYGGRTKKSYRTAFEAID